MTGKILINEIFESIQGEGRFTGHPCLFIRVSKCTRKCSFCDTQYHNQVNKELTPKQLADVVNKSKKQLVVITGGEPLLYIEQILEASNMFKKGKVISLETNGDLLTPELFERIVLPTKIEEMFIGGGDSITYWHFSCSPKDMKSYKNALDIKKRFSTNILDIKVVTDLKLDKDMLKHADYLMPLTTFNEKRDNQIKRKVWEYCVKNNKLYSERVHIDVWGYNQKGI